MLLRKPQLDAAGVRLVAVAKERLGLEEFVKDHWPVNREEEFPVELYIDDCGEPRKDGNTPLFVAANGASQKWSGIASAVSGFGSAAASVKRAKKAGFEGNLKGEGFNLGAVIVSNAAGETHLHHRETFWGDHPKDDELDAAIAKVVADAQVNAAKM